MLYHYQNGTTKDKPSCDGKKPYMSYWHAKRAVKALNRQYDSARVGIYKCKKNNHFHIGNKYIKKERWR